MATDIHKQRPESILRLSRLSKTFPGTRALDNVDLTVRQGEIHALVGQNGSGKSTLVKILAGYHHPDPGYEAWLNGQPLQFTHGARGQHSRLRFVHQDLGLVLELSALDNLGLRVGFHRNSLRTIDWHTQTRLTHQLLAHFDIALNLHEPLGKATPVQRTVVAIAAALAGWEGGPGLLVLDEPTAVLPPREVEKLLETVQQIRHRGTSVLYISHRLEEILRIADCATVLKSGKVVTTRPVAELSTRLLAQLMVGTEVDTEFRTSYRPSAHAPVVLQGCDVSGQFLRGVDFDLHQGEILGLAGLPGSGSMELATGIAGDQKQMLGTLQLSGYPRLPIRHARALGIPILPADRARDSIVSEFSVGENLSLMILNRLRRYGLLRKASEYETVFRWLETLEVKTPSADSPVVSLSGGNQQKVSLARCLAVNPRILVLCEPTAGVDVGTRQAIYDFIAHRAKEGLAVVVSSGDTTDLLAICTRILAFADGRIVRELAGEQITEQEVLHAMQEETI